MSSVHPALMATAVTSSGNTAVSLNTYMAGGGNREGYEGGRRQGHEVGRVG